VPVLTPAAAAVRLAGTRNRSRLRTMVLGLLPEMLTSPAAGWYLLGPAGVPVEAEVRGAPAAFAEAYEAEGRRVDPVHRLVEQRHVPAHDAQLGPAWRTSELFRNVSSRFGIGHILTGPLVDGGQMVGTLNVGRPLSALGFDDDDDRLALAAICAHVSALLLRPTDEGGGPAAVPLTARQRQVVDLVARGLSNAEIGRRLWVSEETVKMTLKRAFRRTGARTRAELVALCARGTASS
jgi:DNA-binding CsgD family transcriptional regulator